MTRQNKYNSNKPRYRSKFERGVAANLTKRGIKFEYEPHKLVYYIKKSGHCKNCGSKDIVERHTYLPDIKIGNMYIELKGRLTSSNRTKMKAVLDSNPDIDLRMLYMYNNFLTKSKKTRYSDWTERVGMRYDFLKIPKDWIQEAIGSRK